MDEGLSHLDDLDVALSSVPELTLFQYQLARLRLLRHAGVRCHIPGMNQLSSGGDERFLAKLLLSDHSLGPEVVPIAFAHSILPGIPSDIVFPRRTEPHRKLKGRGVMLGLGNPISVTAAVTENRHNPVFG